MAQDRGATSLVWIRQKIGELYFSSTPVTGVLEVTIKMDLKPNHEQIEAKEDQSNSVTRNAVRKEICKYISQNLRGNRPIIINGNNVSIVFSDKKSEYVHHITTSGYNDQIKSVYIKRLQVLLTNEINNRFIKWVVSTNFLLSRPLDYIPINDAVVVPNVANIDVDEEIDDSDDDDDAAMEVDEPASDLGV